MKHKKRAEIFKQLREGRNLTQERLADACKCSIKTIGRGENPKENISPETMTDYYCVFNEPHEQELLDSIKNNEKSTSNKNIITLYEITDANIILNKICQGYIDLTGELTGKRYTGELDKYIGITYESVDDNELLDIIKKFMDCIKEYRNKYNEILQTAIGADSEFHNYDYANELADLKLEYSFPLNKVINSLTQYSIEDRYASGDYIGTWGEYQMTVFANFDGVVNLNGSFERCPILYVCNKGYDEIIDKSKKQRILKMETSKLLPKYPPYGTYKPFIVHVENKEKK